jgi:hypothetical protein
VLRQDAAVLRYAPRLIRTMHAQQSAPFSRMALDVLARLQLIKDLSRQTWRHTPLRRGMIHGS